jgi:hypothetical protein
MGDHPEFDAQTIVLGQPLANDTLYLLTSPVAVDLTPFLVMRYCDLCRQPELCYADRVDDRRGLSLKSVARGHQVYAQELVQDLHTPGRQSDTSAG